MQRDTIELDWRVLWDFLEADTDTITRIYTIAAYLESKGVDVELINKPE